MIKVEKKEKLLFRDSTLKTFCTKFACCKYVNGFSFPISFYIAAEPYLQRNEKSESVNQGCGCDRSWMYTFCCVTINAMSHYDTIDISD